MVGGFDLAGGGGGSAESASVPPIPGITTKTLENLPLIQELHSYVSHAKDQMPQAQRVLSPVDHLVMNWEQQQDVGITIRKQDIF